LKCEYFQTLKQKELFFYLRAFYSKTDLASFFAPILSRDTQFAKTIFNNYEKANNLGELADLTHLSLSGFKRRFMETFGMAPQHWLDKEKAKKVYYEINCTQRPFQEISEEFNFSSAPHFNKFCQRMFGMAPGALRENTKKRVLLEDVTYI